MNFVTYSQLKKDVIEWAKELPPNIDIVVGVERSGLIPATILALHLNKPVITLNEYLNGTFNEYEDSKVSISSLYNALIVDDSMSSGRAMTKIKGKLGSNFTYKTGVVYTSGLCDNLVDYHYKIISLPRMFEWNFAHHENLKSAILDIDGVVFGEPPVEDDTEMYEWYLSHPEPLYVPSLPVLGFVTGRLEKYRKVTEETLKRYGIRYGFLKMAQYDTPQERREHSMAEYKADIYKNSNANLFIESSKEQADIIRVLSDKEVICIEEFDV